MQTGFCAEFLRLFFSTPCVVMPLQLSEHVIWLCFTVLTGGGSEEAKEAGTQPGGANTTSGWLRDMSKGFDNCSWVWYLLGDAIESEGDSIRWDKESWFATVGVSADLQTTSSSTCVHAKYLALPEIMLLVRRRSCSTQPLSCTSIAQLEHEVDATSCAAT